MKKEKQNKTVKKKGKSRKEDWSYRFLMKAFSYDKNQYKGCVPLLGKSRRSKPHNLSEEEK
jgi:hypothetical protein